MDRDTSIRWAATLSTRSSAAEPTVTMAKLAAQDGPQIRLVISDFPGAAGLWDGTSRLLLPQGPQAGANSGFAAWEGRVMRRNGLHPKSRHFSVGRCTARQT
jgi:hypothetical protein